jgi:hypothetical protein
VADASYSNFPNLFLFNLNFIFHLSGSVTGTGVEWGRAETRPRPDTRLFLEIIVVSVR